jgi:hypothetical protein
VTGSNVSIAVVDSSTTPRPDFGGRLHQDKLKGRQDVGTQFCSQVVAALERVYREEPGVLGVPLLRAVESA